MKEVYVGLDVHRKKTVYVIQGADGEVVAEGSVPTHREGLHEMAKLSMSAHLIKLHQENRALQHPDDSTWELVQI